MRRTLDLAARPHRRDAGAHHAKNARGGGQAAAPAGGASRGPGGHPGNGGNGRPGHGGYGNGVDVWVPIDPYEHERGYMNRSDRSLVPPAVGGIDRDHASATRDDRRFADREDFVAHLAATMASRRRGRRGIYQGRRPGHFAVGDATPTPGPLRLLKVVDR